MLAPVLMCMYFAGGNADQVAWPQDILDWCCLLVQSMRHSGSTLASQSLWLNPSGLGKRWACFHWQFLLDILWPLVRWISTQTWKCLIVATLVTRTGCYFETSPAQSHVALCWLIASCLSSFSFWVDSNHHTAFCYDGFLSMRMSFSIDNAQQPAAKLTRALP